MSIIAPLVFTRAVGPNNPSITTQNSDWTVGGPFRPMRTGVKIQGIYFYTALTGLKTYKGTIWDPDGNVVRTGTVDHVGPGYGMVEFSSFLEFDNTHFQGMTSAIADCWTFGLYNTTDSYFTLSDGGAWDMTYLHYLGHHHLGYSSVDYVLAPIHYSAGDARPLAAHGINYVKMVPMDLIIELPDSIDFLYDADPYVYAYGQYNPTLAATAGDNTLAYRFQLIAPGTLYGVRFYTPSAGTFRHRFVKSTVPYTLAETTDAVGAGLHDVYFSSPLVIDRTFLQTQQNLWKYGYITQYETSGTFHVKSTKATGEELYRSNNRAITGMVVYGPDNWFIGTGDIEYSGFGLIRENGYPFMPLIKADS